jgi:hypothetical protein
MRRMTFRDAPERGAVAMLVAIFFGTGAFFALAALTIDVGNINADRRQLQNGADSVALAVARQCVKDGTCNPSDTSLQTLVDANAADGATEIRRVDGQTPAICGQGPGLTACPTSPAPDPKNLQECPSPILTGTFKYVRVYTETKNAAGVHILPYSFGAAIAGVGSGANQQTCASVAWGPAGVSASLPFAFSACEWNNATAPVPPATQRAYPPSPPYDSVTNPMNPLWEKTIAFNTINGTDCTWNGHDFAGGFGWLCHDSTCTPPAASTCSITTSGGWVDAVTGNGGGNDCRSNIQDSVGTVIFIPVFDCINPNKNYCPDPVGTDKSTGTHTYYHIQGYASFFLTAVDDGAIQANLTGYPTVASKASCSAKGGKCLFGWFTQGLSKVPGAKIDPNAHDFGLSVIQLAG